VSKVEQIFDLLLKEKQLKLPQGYKLPTAQELQGITSYCKWHHSFTHNTSDCKELRRQIQSAIEQGQLILGPTAMKVDTQPFPSVNMVEGYDRSARRQLEEQVRHVKNQRPASSDLLKKYEYQYQQHLQHETEEEEYERRTRKSLKKRGDARDHWHCPFFK
jgi:hypothetical protein